MRRLLVVLSLIFTPLPASATPELASQWGHKAADLHAETTALIHQLDLGHRAQFQADYFYEIERFSMTAARLGNWIDQSGQAPDLGCIFRGMATEGELQLEALDGDPGSGAARAALRRLATMFADAEMIAVASSRRTYLSPMARSSAAPASCPASADAALYALR